MAVAGEGVAIKKKMNKIGLTKISLRNETGKLQAIL
jgi:hypothetical protein